MSKPANGDGPDGGDNGKPRHDRNAKGEPNSAQKASGSRSRIPLAGPHADPSLTNEEATPGAGTLPSPDAGSDNGGSVSS